MIKVNKALLKIKVKQVILEKIKSIKKRKKMEAYKLLHIS